MTMVLVHNSFGEEKPVRSFTAIKIIKIEKFENTYVLFFLNMAD